MTKPVIDPSQLTKEQRTKIIDEYAIAKSRAELNFYENTDELETLVWLFGKTMFEK